MAANTKRVIVPSIDDMDDETFKKHANLRHRGDFLIPLTEHDVTPGVLKPAREAHDFWHRTHDVSDYNHDHEEEE